MKGMFDDWQAQGITSVLHEKKGGYAFNKDSIKALENKSTSNGVQVIKGVTVNGFKRGSNSKALLLLPLLKPLTVTPLIT